MENKTKDWEKLSPRVKAYILNCYPCEAYQEIVKGFLGEEGKDTHPKFLDQDTLHHVFNYFTTQDSRAIARPGHGFEDLRPLEESTPQALGISDVAGQSEQLKAFADYAQKRMWENGDKDLSGFVDEFLSL